MNNNSNRISIILRYCAGGGVGVLLYYIVFYGLTELFGAWYLLSSIIGFVASVATNFIIHKFWTFKNNDNNKTRQQAIRFAVLQISLFTGNTVFLYVLVEYAKLNYLFAQFILTVVFTIIGYTISNKIFRSNK